MVSTQDVDIENSLLMSSFGLIDAKKSASGKV